MIADEFLAHKRSGHVVGFKRIICENINTKQWFAHFEPCIAQSPGLSVGPYDSKEAARASIEEELAMLYPASALSFDRLGWKRAEVEKVGGIRQDPHGNELLELCRINNISVWPLDKCCHTGDFIIQMLGYATFAPTRDEHSVRIGHLEVPDSMVEEAGFPGIQVYGKTLAQVIARALIVARAIVEADAFGLTWTPDVRDEVD